MKKISTLLGFVLLAILVWRVSRSSAPVATPEPQADVATQAPSVKAPIPPLQKRQARAPAVPPPTRTASVNAVAPVRDDPHVVPFEVVSGKFAVAYGDVLMGEIQDDIDKGYARLPPSRRWPSREIPYAIQVSRPERVEKALAYLAQHTPLRFVPYNGQKDAILFSDSDERCLSYVGRMGGVQPIYLGPECGSSEVMHETLHAIGFVHEQSRRIRDEYVEILWDNIEDSKRSQFEIAPAEYMEIFNNAPFDYHSIMLYSPSAFTKAPDLQSMRSKRREQIEPVENALSPEDIRRLEQLYPAETSQQAGDE